MNFFSRSTTLAGCSYISAASSAGCRLPPSPFRSCSQQASCGLGSRSVRRPLVASGGERPMRSKRQASTPARWRPYAAARTGDDEGSPRASPLGEGRCSAQNRTHLSASLISILFYFLFLLPYSLSSHSQKKYRKAIVCLASYPHLNFFSSSIFSVL